MDSSTKNNPISGVFVDTLSFTITNESMTGLGFKSQLDNSYGPRFMMNLKQFFIKLDCGISVESPRGFGGRFYKDSCKLVYTSGMDGAGDLGTVYFGGDQNKDTINFLMTGECCDFLNIHGFMVKIHDHLVEYDTKLTRVDLATDFKDGQYNLQNIKDWYQLGYFNTGGRMPDIGAVLNGSLEFDEANSRTVYIGSRQSAKFFRAYEKGHQLGDLTSKWVRYEMEYKAKNDALLPLEMLIKCASYFKSAYPAFEKIDKEFLNNAEPEFIRSMVKEKTKIYIEECVHNVRVAYGRVLNVLTGLGQTPDQILLAISRSGLPSRLIVPEMEPVLFYQDEESFGDSCVGDCPI